MKTKTSAKIVACILLLISLLTSVTYASGYDSESSFHVNKLTAFIPEDALAATIKSVDDYEDMTKGTQSVMKSFAGGLDEFAPELKKCITAVAVTATEICDIETAHKIAVAVAEKIKIVGKATAKGIPLVKLSVLPKEAEDTLKLIEKGGPFPYPSKDNKLWRNELNDLPQQPFGYYKEFTVPTPGAIDRGQRRIITGGKGEVYYSDDHYKTFKMVIENAN